jgi:hypothetical protein
MCEESGYIPDAKNMIRHLKDAIAIFGYGKEPMFEYLMSLPTAPSLNADLLYELALSMLNNGSAKSQRGLEYLFKIGKGELKPGVLISKHHEYMTPDAIDVLLHLPPYEGDVPLDFSTVMNIARTHSMDGDGDEVMILLLRHGVPPTPEVPIYPRSIDWDLLRKTQACPKCAHRT